MQVLGVSFKFNQPFMCSTTFITEIYGSCSVVTNDCTGGCTGFSNGFFGIINNQFLTKGIDEMCGSSCNADAIGSGGSEGNGIAYPITPEPGIRGNNNGILFTRFYLVKCQGWRIFPVPVFHRDEFIINSV